MQLFTLQDANWWTGLVWITCGLLFLSAVWMLILTAPIHCRGYIGEQVMQCKISPNLFWGRNFWVNYSFKSHKHLCLCKTAAHFCTDLIALCFTIKRLVVSAQRRSVLATQTAFLSVPSCFPGETSAKSTLSVSTSLQQTEQAPAISAPTTTDTNKTQSSAYLLAEFPGCWIWMLKSRCQKAKQHVSPDLEVVDCMCLRDVFICWIHRDREVLAVYICLGRLITNGLLKHITV